MSEYLPWLVTALTLYGAYRNSKGDLLGSSGIWFVTNLFWLYMDVSRDLYAQAFVYGAFIAMNIFGLYTGIKSRIKEPSDYEEFEY